MAATGSKCRDCGGSIPTNAQFCPRCGLSVRPPLEAPGNKATINVQISSGPGLERFGFPIAFFVVLVVALLAWPLIQAIGSDSAEPGGSTTTQAPPTTVTSATTRVPPQSTTSALPGPDYVNGVRGPVLANHVAGIVVGAGSDRLTTIDLATGQISTIDVTFGFNRTIIGIVDEEVFVADVQFLRAVDIASGAERTLFETDPPANSHQWILGLADDESAWVVTENEATGASTAARVDFTGETIESLEFESPIFVAGANGQQLHLEAPGASFIFDSTSSTVTELEGRLIGSRSAASVLLSCRSLGDCLVEIDVGSGFEPTDAITAADMTTGGLLISPDRTEALTHRFLDDGPEITHIDLTTAERLTVRDFDLTSEGFIWIPDTAWIVGAGLPSGDLLAVNTETSATVVIELPFLGIRVDFGDGSPLAYISPS